MLGAIAGDIIGSIYEFNNIKTTKFNVLDNRGFFTDDTVLTIAIADAILHKKDYAGALHEWGNLYPDESYGGRFREWLASSHKKPYNSWGNGSAMRVAPVGFYFDTLKNVLEHAKKTAVATHNHPEGIKGAEAVAASIFLARTGKSKIEIKNYIVSEFGYKLNRTIDQIRPDYRFDVSCAGSVPEAIIAFLESKDFESAIRLAVSIGGDSDTIACITGGIAEAFYGGLPEKIKNHCEKKLTPEMLDITNQFYEKLSYSV